MYVGFLSLHISVSCWGPHGTLDIEINVHKLSLSLSLSVSEDLYLVLDL